MTRLRLADAFLATVVVFFGVIAPAQGNVVLFNTAAGYYAATTGNTTVDFTGIAPANNYVQEIVPPGLTVGAVNFTIDTAASNGTLYAVDAGYSNNFFHVTLLDSQFSSATNDNILITLPYAVTAVALDFGSNNGSTIAFALSTGDTFTRGTTAQAIQFVGLTSTTPFTTITLSDPIQGAVVLQDFTYSSAAVPLPSALGAGSLLMAFLATTRKRRPA